MEVSCGHRDPEPCPSRQTLPREVRTPFLDLLYLAGSQGRILPSVLSGCLPRKAGGPRHHPTETDTRSGTPRGMKASHSRPLFPLPEDSQVPRSPAGGLNAPGLQAPSAERLKVGSRPQYRHGLPVHSLWSPERNSPLLTEPVPEKEGPIPQSRHWPAGVVDGDGRIGKGGDPKR